MLKIIAVGRLTSLADPDYTHPAAELKGFRTILGVPMSREGIPIGGFSIWRNQVVSFTDKQIELVTTFVDQVVIAIENMRLFRELEGPEPRPHRDSRVRRRGRRGD